MKYSPGNKVSVLDERIPESIGFEDDPHRLPILMEEVLLGSPQKSLERSEMDCSPSKGSQNVSIQSGQYDCMMLSEVQVWNCC